MQIVTRRIEDLIPHPKNYRQHPPNQIATIDESLTHHDQQCPVVIWKGGNDESGVYLPPNTILKGHGLVQAATAKGWTEIECIVYTRDKPTAFLIIDNHSADTSVDDTHALVELLRELTAADVTPEAIGFDADEITALLQQFDDATPPAFTPASEDEQGHLDKKKTVTCPECGHAFTA
jgi:hypothetical protein